MPADRMKRVEALFHEALEAAPETRDVLLRERCAGDPEMLAEVQALLGEAEDGTRAALWSPFGEPAAEPSVSGGDEEPGEQIGRYRLVRPVGEGGFGAVWEAEQTEPIRRRVAVKLLKPGMDTRQVLRRFEAERQTLASLDHPNVAKVLDAGRSPRGRPYFVMEFIDGQPIDAFCDARRLGVRDRLLLFLQVAGAIQHAHQKGIIHRDLKPSNVLVSADADAGPVARVIDFGIAKAIAPGADRSIVTQEGQYLGTPAYMSPEQASGDPTRIDTRTDVYALGAILYRLLCGSAPLDEQTLRSASFATIQHLIAEVDPPRPSARIAQSEDGGVAAAGARSSDPQRLARRLAGDLDWIALRALEKDPARRYPGVAEFAGDVQAHLDDRPVSAGPPSALYVARKFVRRHRVPVAAGAAVAVAVLVGAAGTGVGFARALRAEAEAIALAASESEQRRRAEESASAEAAARALAEARAEELAAVTDFQQDMLRGVDPGAMGQAFVRRLRADAEHALAREGRTPDEIREDLSTIDRLAAAANPTNAALAVLDEHILDRAAVAIDAQFAGRAATAAALRQSIGATYRALGLLDRGRPQLELALETRRRVLGADHEHTLATLGELGTLVQAQGRLDQAEPMLRDLLEARRRVLGEDHKDTLNAEHNLAMLLLDLGRANEAEPLSRHAVDAGRRRHPDRELDVLQWVAGLGQVLMEQGRLRDAEPYYREVLDGRRRLLGADHPRTAISANNLGYLHWRMGSTEQALQYMREALDIQRRSLGDEHPDTVTTFNNVAAMLHISRRYDEAKVLMEDALATARRTIGPNHPGTLRVAYSLASLLSDMGRSEEAVALLQDVAARRAEHLGPTHPDTLTTERQLGSVLTGMGRHAEAEAILARAFERTISAVGERHPDVAMSLEFLGNNLLAQGRLSEAAGFLRRARELHVEILGPAHRRTLNVTAMLGLAVARSADPQEGLALTTEAHENAARTLGPDNAVTLLSGRAHASALAAAERFTDAESLALDLLPRFERTFGPAHRSTIEHIEVIAEVYEAWRDAEPGAGHDAQVERWRSLLVERREAKQTPAETPAPSAQR